MDEINNKTFAKDYYNKSYNLMIDNGFTFSYVNSSDIKNVQHIANGAFKNTYKINCNENIYAMKLTMKNNNQLGFILKNNREIIMSHDTDCQQICCVIYYSMINELKQKNKNVKLNMSRPIMIDHNYDELNKVMIEVYITGIFKKFILQNGKKCDDINTETSNLCQCLVHYSYAFTKGYCCIADIQGSTEWLTDCCLNTKSGETNIADAGEIGILSCALLHECNDFCKLLGLKDTLTETSIASQMTNDKAKIYAKLNIRDEIYKPFNNLMQTKDSLILAKN